MHVSRNRLQSLEWLETNGLGGYSSATISDKNTTRYHGLLCAAFSPEDRRMFLSSLGELLTVGENTLQLDNPKGFELSPFPTFTYQFHKSIIKKTVFMPYLMNAVVVRYDISTSRPDATFSAEAKITSRDHNWVLHNPNWKFDCSISGNIANLVPTHLNPPTICIGTSEGEITDQKIDCRGHALERVLYPKDRLRGHDGFEDVFFGPQISISTPLNNTFFIVASAANETVSAKKACENILKNPQKYLEAELDRRADLISDDKKLFRCPLKTTKLGKDFILASDKFLVCSNAKTRTPDSIIAGYPWFGVWGRDSLISMPGLCLATKRYDSARKILSSLASRSRNGLIPNNFMGQANFNSLDSSLWFFWAVGKYIEYTGDTAFVRDKLWAHMKKTISTYSSFTDDYGMISTDKSADTWMDVILDGVPVTPRPGRSIEIQALWYNALRINADLSIAFGERDSYEKIARGLKDNFTDIFWNPKRRYLYDYVKDDYSEESIRPNALFAMSLQYPLLEENRFSAIVKTAKKDLLTPFGLRTLPKWDERFHPSAAGIQRQRDLAYHQGDVWPWLIGAFVDSHKRAHPDKDICGFIKPLMENLDSPQAVRCIDEVFDGSYPHAPSGCITQAWSVAEILRVFWENL